MNIRCPNCQTMFRVDPARVPPAGVRARCARCGTTFGVRRDDVSPEPVAGAGGRTGTASGGGGAQQPPAAAQGSPATTADSAGPARPAVTPEVNAPDSQAAAPAQQPGGSRDAAPPAPPAVAGPGAAQRPVAPAGGAAPEAAEARPRTPIFGSRDPDSRAQRIARALVSDIVAYHPKRREESLAAGTLRTDFREEIMKSWEEYVAQVGLELAKSTPHFRNALNDILARGQRVF